ncbi:hypothetical protein D3C81_1704700 [compost metagenome]
MQVLRGIEFDGAVPVAGGAHYPGLFAETGNAQFQRITEAIDAQLSCLLERFARLFQSIRARVGFGTHREHRPPQ